MNYNRPDEEYEQDKKRRPDVNHIGKDGITLTEDTVDELLSWLPAVIFCFILPPLGIFMVFRKLKDLNRKREYRRRYEQERYERERREWEHRNHHHHDVEIDFSQAAEAIGSFADKIASQVQTAFRQAQNNKQQAARDEAQSAAFESAKPEAPKREEPKKEEPKKEEPRREEPAKSGDNNIYEDYLRKILEVNNRIKDEAVSAKIDRIGSLSADIFATVGQRPEKIKANRKFMDYYLPTTLKLLESYSLMEAQNNRGADVQHAMTKVSNVLDTLSVAFEKHLDQLRKPDVLDVEAEAAALESILAQDGLASPKGTSFR